MKLILTIAFNSLVTAKINIENPSYVPDIGDIVDIVPEDYLSDKNDINTLREYAANDIWRVGFKTITYEKDKVSVLVVLEEEKHFDEHQKERNNL
jgi:hypothetical protein